MGVSSFLKLALFCWGWNFDTVSFWKLYTFYYHYVPSDKILSFAFNFSISSLATFSLWLLSVAIKSCSLQNFSTALSNFSAFLSNSAFTSFCKIRERYWNPCCVQSIFQISDQCFKNTLSGTQPWRWPLHFPFSGPVYHAPLSARLLNLWEFYFCF